MSAQGHVRLFEVGPRDGLQNEAAFVATEAKVQLVNRLSRTGLQDIEVTSFVAPAWIPQLADARDVLSQIERVEGVRYSALVPNARGLERALAANVDAVNVFMSASETHNRKNINKSIADTYPILAAVVQSAKAAGKPVRGYVSTAFGCPYEGDVPIAAVIAVTEQLLAMGVDEISLGDTIGVAVPTQVVQVVDALQGRVPLAQIALHFHDTRGMAMANVYSGWLKGIRTFDGSLGGLGGCPYAPGASGNVATDDLQYLFAGLGVDTGVDTAALSAVSAWFEQAIGKPLASHARAVARGQVGSETNV